MKKTRASLTSLLTLVAPFALLLNGCDGSGIKTILNNDTPKSTAQVSQWAQDIRTQANASVNEPDQLIATRPLTELPASPLNAHVFIANPDNKASTVEPASTKAADSDASTQIVYGSGDSNNSAGASSSYRITPSYAATKPTLAQAELSDLHFTGFLRQNNAEWAVLKVGDRLYRVKAGDVIGKGKWPVQSISESAIALTVNNTAQRISREPNPQATLQKGMNP